MRIKYSSRRRVFLVPLISLYASLCRVRYTGDRRNEGSKTEKLKGNLRGKEKRKELTGMKNY
jgi:hypothetical protein